VLMSGNTTLGDAGFRILFHNDLRTSKTLHMALT